MLRTTHSTTQHHNPADWNIFYTRFLLAKNIKISCLECDGVQLDRQRDLRNHLHLHGQPWLHTIICQQTATHVIPTIQPLPFNACFILIMVPLCLPQSCNTVAQFYLFLHTVLRYIYYQHMSLYIFFTSLNCASSLPNASIVNNSIYFTLVLSHWPTES